MSCHAACWSLRKVGHSVLRCFAYWLTCRVEEILVCWVVCLAVAHRAMSVSAKEIPIFGSSSLLAEAQQKEYRLGSEITHNNQINQDAQLKAGL